MCGINFSIIRFLYTKIRERARKFEALNTFNYKNTMAYEWRWIWSRAIFIYLKDKKDYLKDESQRTSELSHNGTTT